ncbi:hypothetical protein BBK14_26280 [Parafrankia soli]|uniref:Uncharacterized protein n=1 Tax=Parafrankia soli TaxID=2599596 RepID=A0A1S1PKX6_9ACTN|nr:hypothetical protein BBK14_26280 [Parafrankia soli]
MSTRRPAGTGPVRRGSSPARVLSPAGHGPFREGVEMQCALIDPADGTTHPVDVTVDSVDGANTAFSFEIGEPADA